MFISLEGTDGVGKSTLLHRLQANLTAAGYDVYCTKEPGGTQVADALRAIIVSQPIEDLTELYLLQAARHEHVKKVLLPKLKEGAIILCDRYTDSTLAYQGGGRGLNLKRLAQLNKESTEGLQPDLTFFLDQDPGKSMKRVRERTRMEKEGLAFQKKVYQAYRRIMKTSGRRWFSIDVKDRTAQEVECIAAQELHRRILSFSLKKKKAS